MFALSDIRSVYSDVMALHQIFDRRMRRLPKLARLLLLLTGVCSFIMYSYVVYYVFWKNHTSDLSYLEVGITV